MAQILDHNAQFKNFRIQNDTATDKTENTESSNKKSFKISMESLKSDNVTDNIFDMIAPVETNHNFESNEIEGFFDANVIHC